MGSRTSSNRMTENESSVSEESDNYEEEWYTGSSDDSADLENNYLQLLESLMTSDDVLEARTMTDLGSYRKRAPKIRHHADTTVLDKSEFSIQTKLASGLSNTNPNVNNNNVASMVVEREKGIKRHCGFSSASQVKITNRYLPNQVSHLPDTSGKMFCGIFSKDGNCYLTASQDKYITLYNSADESYNVIQNLTARDVGWSILDIAFSPDRQHYVYSTWSSSLHICPAKKDSEEQIPLTLLNTGRRFCVFSVVFSSDGKELLCGANDGHLYIYDRQRNENTTKIPAHTLDVNSVCFADDSSHIIYSGGDDGLVKVWDRRTLNERHARPVGILAGHIDGITFVDSRGDGRHLISNSKDQSLKLWDVRVFSGKKAAEMCLKEVQNQSWDYRWQDVPTKLFKSSNRIEGDTSLMTYREHMVMKTLIRCRFSPKETTGQRYIYTGCGLGRVVIYDALTGKVVRKEEVHHGCVRDVYWHPYRTEILSASWDGQVGRWYYKENDFMAESLPKSIDEKSERKGSKPCRRSERLKSRRRNVNS